MASTAAKSRYLRRFAVLFALTTGIFVYGREWLVLLQIVSFPEDDFFRGYPNLLSPVPGVMLVLGFIFHKYPFSTWAAFLVPSLFAHHAIMLSWGMFNMWPGFLIAHGLLIIGMLPISLVGAWAGRMYAKRKEEAG